MLKKLKTFLIIITKAFILTSKHIDELQLNQFSYKLYSEKIEFTLKILL